MGVVIGEKAAKLCLDNAITDDHLSPSTILVVLHGEFVGSPSKRNLCVFLVDTAQKQQKLKGCFEAIYQRHLTGNTPAAAKQEPAGRTSFGPGAPAEIPTGRTSFGPGGGGGAVGSKPPDKWVPPQGFEDSDDESPLTSKPKAGKDTSTRPMGM